MIHRERRQPVLAFVVTREHVSQPGFLVNEDGSLGDRNGVKCLSIEHKLGIHGSPTCVMEYDGATGYHPPDTYYGYHPPTMYFPLVVEECLMFEPTETEDRATLEAFAEALLSIAAEVQSDPELVKHAPTSTPS